MARHYFKLGKLLEGHPFYGKEGIETAYDAAAYYKDGCQKAVAIWNEFAQSLIPGEAIKADFNAEAIKAVFNDREMVGVAIDPDVAVPKALESCLCKPSRGDRRRSRSLRVRATSAKYNDYYAEISAAWAEANAKGRACIPNIEDGWAAIGYSSLALMIEGATKFSLDWLVFVETGGSRPNYCEYVEILGSEYANNLEAFRERSQR